MDDYQDLLRLSVATAGNDHRLGANEAPPAVVSIFLGDELTAILDAIEKDEPYSGTEKTVMKLGVHVLPKFTRDTTDRNRTSPFAFTGNKFEFRMLGSAELHRLLQHHAQRGGGRVPAAVRRRAGRRRGLRSRPARPHPVDHQGAQAHHLQRQRLRRGLDQGGHRGARPAESAHDAGRSATILEKKNVDMLTSLKVFSEAEIRSRYEIMLENYCKTVNIEAETMVDMARREILPAVEKFSAKLAQDIAPRRRLAPVVSGNYEISADHAAVRPC